MVSEAGWKLIQKYLPQSILPVMRAYKLPHGKAAGGKLLTGPDD